MAHDQGRSPCSIKQSAVINKKVVPCKNTSSVRGMQVTI